MAASNGNTLPSSANLSVANTTTGLNTTTDSKQSQRSLIRSTSALFHRIQSTSFLGPKSYNVTIYLLDDAKSLSANFRKTTTAQDVLDFVCKELNIVEKDFFGLRYISSDTYRYWVNLSQPLSKISSGNDITLYFRFCFYPDSLEAVREEITRYQLFVQLCRDLLHGRLKCDSNESVHLAALILQAEQGDYNPDRHFDGYVSQYKLLHGQTERIERRISEIHQSFSHMSPDEAINRFLENCFKLENYGINPYVVKVGKSHKDVVIGASSSKLLVLVINQIIYEIPWNFIDKIDFSRKQLKVRIKKEFFGEYLDAHPHLSPAITLQKIYGEPDLVEDLKLPKSDEKLQLKFTCPNATFAKNVWRHLLSQQAFFNAESAQAVKPRFSKPKIPLLTRGSTFRCPTKRTMLEIKNDTLLPRNDQDQQREFVRYTLPQKLPRSASGAERTPSSTAPSIQLDTDTTPTTNTDFHNDEANSSESNISLGSSNETIHADSPSTSTPNGSVKYSAGINSIHISTPHDQALLPEKPTQNGALAAAGDSLPPTQYPFTGNGTTSNGNTSIANEENTANLVVTKPQSLSRRAFVTILDLMLVFLLMLIVVAAVFETHPHDPTWFHPHISTFRANHYNSWKASTLGLYRRIFGQ